MSMIKLLMNVTVKLFLISLAKIFDCGLVDLTYLF